MEYHARLASLPQMSGEIIYVAPERLGCSMFVDALEKFHICLLAVHEAHCMSQWGHDFRPAYRRLSGIRAALGQPPTLEFSATASPKVQADVIENVDTPKLSALPLVLSQSVLRVKALREYQA